MKSLLVIGTAIVILFSQSMSSLVYLDWSIHKKQLVKSCCIQKDEVVNTCQASCCLKKDLAKTRAKGDFNFSQPRVTWTVSRIDISLPRVVDYTKNVKPKVVYTAMYSETFLNRLIKPPGYLLS